MRRKFISQGLKYFHYFFILGEKFFCPYHLLHQQASRSIAAMNNKVLLWAPLHRFLWDGNLFPKDRKIFITFLSLGRNFSALSLLSFATSASIKKHSRNGKQAAIVRWFSWISIEIHFPMIEKITLFFHPRGEIFLSCHCYNLLHLQLSRSIAATVHKWKL